MQSCSKLGIQTNATHQRPYLFYTYVCGTPDRARLGPDCCASQTGMHVSSREVASQPDLCVAAALAMAH